MDLEQLNGYAEYIGIDKDEENLMWIAREGLQAPVPDGYEERYTEEGDAEFVNVKTGEVSYDHPLDDVYR